MDLVEVNKSGVTRSSNATSESSAEVNFLRSGVNEFEMYSKSFPFSRVLKRQRLESLRAQVEHKKVLLKVSRRELMEMFSLV